MSCAYEKQYKPEVCPVLGFQDVLVGVPVEIKPFAQVGEVKTECMGKPVIKRGSIECEGKPRKTCKFVINQKIRVEVPVIFGAKTEVGEASIDCKHHGMPCGLEKKIYEETSKEDYFKGMVV